MELALLGALFGIQIIWVTAFIFSVRMKLTCMVGMMASMALGMTSGLATGTALTLWLPGEFFLSTLLSMFIGGAVGVISGASISLMAVLDGLLSGMMAGMMGAMLMVMIPLPFVDLTVRIMVVLCTGIVFILLLLLQSEINPEILNQKPIMFTKTYPMFLLIVLTIAISLVVPKDNLPKSFAQQHNEHNNNTSTNELIVRATEYSFQPASLHVKVGQKVKITLENDGHLEHDFEIVGTNVHIHAASGEKNSTLVSFDQAGYFQVICTLPGHKESGMTASIQVVS